MKLLAPLIAATVLAMFLYNDHCDPSRSITIGHSFLSAGCPL